MTTSKEGRIDMLSRTTITKRVEALDWSRIGRDLDERGYAVTWCNPPDPSK
jgi:hypothetical protein